MAKAAVKIKRMPIMQNALLEEFKNLKYLFVLDAAINPVKKYNPELKYL